MIAKCPRCQTELEVPNSENEFQVTCPVCRRSFTCLPPSKVSVYSQLRRQTPVSRPDYGRMRTIRNLWKIAVGIVVTLVIFFGGRHYMKTRRDRQIAVQQQIISEAKAKIDQLTPELNQTDARLHEVREGAKQAASDRDLAQSKVDDLHRRLANLSEEPVPEPTAEPAPAPAPAPETAPDYREKIARLEDEVKEKQKELVKIGCHYNCYHTTVIKERRWDENRNRYRTYTVRNPGFTCSKHGYTWYGRMQFLDYTNQQSQLNREINDLNARISDLQKRQSRPDLRPAPPEPPAKRKLLPVALTPLRTKWEQQLADYTRQLKVAEERLASYQAEETKLQSQRHELDRAIINWQNAIVDAEAALRGLTR